MQDVTGYVLRIATEEWVRQVLDTAIYYTSIRRKWQTQQTVLFLHKTETGDAFIGYGVIGKVLGVDELSEEEQQECEKHRWNRAIEFSYVIRFRKPLLLKETYLKNCRTRGRLLHGLALTSDQLSSIIKQGEKLS